MNCPITGGRALTIVPRSRYTAATMIRNRINSPLYCAVCAAVLYAAFVALRLGAGGADVWSFALVGSDFAIQREMHPAVRIQPGQGYDGQFFFGLAHEPVTHDSVAGGVRLDHPAYRQQRILYPLLVWLLSQGSYHLMPWMLVAVNWAALIAVAYIGGALAAHCGRPHALWGLLPACYPGYLLSFSRDLAEPLTAAMLLWGLWRLAAHKRWAALPLCLAVLCRETAVLLPAALVAAALWKGRRDWLLAGVLPLCVLALWQAVVWGALWAAFLAGWGREPRSALCRARARAYAEPAPIGTAIARLVCGAVGMPCGLRRSRRGRHSRLERQGSGAVSAYRLDVRFCAHAAAFARRVGGRLGVHARGRRTGPVFSHIGIFGGAAMAACDGCGSRRLFMAGSGPQNSVAGLKRKAGERG